MTEANPAFGVGIGRFYSRSGEFSSSGAAQEFPPAVHENAHNNFLQILAELGIVGFGVMMWLLWTAAGYGRRLLGADMHDPLRWGLMTGLSAFVLSCLGGHPLLIDEPAFAFWLVSAPWRGGAHHSTRPRAHDWGRGQSPWRSSRSPLRYLCVLIVRKPTLTSSTAASVYQAGTTQLTVSVTARLGLRAASFCPPTRR